MIVLTTSVIGRGLGRLAVFALAGATVAAATAQGFGSVPKAEIKLTKPSAVAGSIVTGKVIVTFEEGLHGYQNPPVESYQIPISLRLGDKVFKIVKIAYPKGEAATVGGETKPSMVYHGTIEIPFQLRAPVKKGPVALKMLLDYQLCNASACFPPGQVKLATTVKLTPAKVTKPKKRKGQA